MNRTSNYRLLALALFAMGAAVCAAEDAGAAKTMPAKPSTTPPATLPAKPSTAAPVTDVQKLTDQFNQQRDKMLADRQALLDSLKKANEKERAAILKQLESQQKEFAEAQRALYKQLRDDLRKERANKPPGK